MHDIDMFIKIIMVAFIALCVGFYIFGYDDLKIMFDYLMKNEVYPIIVDKIKRKTIKKVKKIFKK
jgi:Na+-translocating ferredoxin:NAD+ oxidoreductase RnfD subunit